ncbi:MAG TPA: GNAT family protein [Gaiellales bacterium]|nr:GNAT family protein [Gaiellales bacterium]
MVLRRWTIEDLTVAVVEVGNPASQRVVETNGLRREGRLRSYLSFEDRRADALVYSLLATDLGLEWPRNNGV